MGALPLYHSLDADDYSDCLDTDVELGASYGTQPSLPVHNISPFSIFTISSIPTVHCNRSAGAVSAGSFCRLCGSLLAGGSASMESSWGSIAGRSIAGSSEGESDEVRSVGTGTSRMQTVSVLIASTVRADIKQRTNTTRIFLFLFCNSFSWVICRSGYTRKSIYCIIGTSQRQMRLGTRVFQWLISTIR